MASIDVPVAMWVRMPILVGLIEPHGRPGLWALRS